MKLLRCPVNGLRPISEFVWGGEVRDMPDPDAVSDAEWAHYVFDRSGVPAVKREWWYHVPSGVWFIAERDTVADRVLRTYPYGGDA
ncbi:MAG: sarcosine oxidase subunit delta [Pseudomonadota bacterium]|jgi:Sarcosine oxidase delta subunit|nr:MAG: sarcosine oxidase subunit delta [Pseudomonadota bacterium]